MTKVDYLAETLTDLNQTLSLLDIFSESPVVPQSCLMALCEEHIGKCPEIDLRGISDALCDLVQAEAEKELTRKETSERALELVGLGPNLDLSAPMAALILLSDLLLGCQLPKLSESLIVTGHRTVPSWKEKAYWRRILEALVHFSVTNELEVLNEKLEIVEVLRLKKSEDVTG